MASSFLRSLVRLDEVGSTSTYARQLVMEGSHGPLPLLVRARRQTAGRGRGDHVWWSDEGGLMFTLVLDPAEHALRAEHEPRLALAAALAIVDAIGPCPPGVAPGIRWPNDVEADDLKLAGLLPERVETSRGPKLLLGVGVNISSDLESAPEAVRRMATTVERLLRRPVDADDFLADFLACLVDNLRLLAADDPGLIERCNQVDALAGRRVRLDLGTGRIVAGTARGIDDRGGLLIETPEGTQPYYGGQVLR
jgi:BirA family biotin operon repressor/biotin-[acetyl-CoA-carboxylase] ligase